MRMARRLDFGCVWINTHIPLVAEMPHGGFKHSGYGKDLSMYGLEDYTRIKHVMSNIGQLTSRRVTARLRQEAHGDQCTPTVRSPRPGPRAGQAVPTLGAPRRRRPRHAWRPAAPVPARPPAVADGGTAAAKPSPAADRSATEKVVNWANWTLYLDYDDKTKKYPTLEAFQKQTGIKATYAEDIDDNDTYYGKIRGQLQNGQDIGKDVIVFTDWMAAR